MSAPRPTPFDLVFGDSAGPRLQSIRAALTGAGQDPRDRDAFLMIREVVELLRELRPDEGLGEGIDQLAALVHHCYLFWDSGCRTVDVDQERVVELMGPPPAGDQPEQRPFYARMPERRVWAEAVPGAAQEPLDGCFIYDSPDSRAIHVLGIFGLHRDRAGFSVVEIAGDRPSALLRADGSNLFSAALPGGAAAGLFSITGEEELLELGWRLRALAEEPAVEAG
ncbi:MAG: hypothetical protein ACJ8BF_06750 [Gemmatimonadales bacterium]